MLYISNLFFSMFPENIKDFWKILTELVGTQWEHHNDSSQPYKRKDWGNIWSPYEN